VYAGVLLDLKLIGWYALTATRIIRPCVCKKEKIPILMFD
jgi:hypothetical protein